MNYPFYFEPKNSLILFNLEKEFDFLSKLYSKKKLPKVLMISGNKGSGKSTLINHFFSQFLMKKIIMLILIRYLNLQFFLNILEMTFFEYYLY